MPNLLHGARNSILLALPMLLLPAAHATQPLTPETGFPSPNRGTTPAPLTLREALDSAWHKAMQTPLGDARHLQVEAARAVARSWFPEAPSVGVAETSDRFGRNQGNREREIELTLPLWLPGQRDARLNLASSEATELTAAQTATRLSLAGELRSAIWVHAVARAEHDMERERLANATVLEADVARREKAGELARTDKLLASEEVLAAQGAVAQASKSEQQALERYRRLTGLQHVPVAPDEAVNQADAAGSRDNTDHPRVRLAAADLARAHAQLQWTATDKRGTPELSIALQQARDGAGAAHANSVRFGIRIPLGTETRNAPQLAEAHANVVRAQVALSQVTAEVETEQRMAVIGLYNAKLLHQSQQARTALANERLRLQARALQLGELGLSEFMRIRAAANEARLDALRAALSLAAARAQVNQTQGLLP